MFMRINKSKFILMLIFASLFYIHPLLSLFSSVSDREYAVISSVQFSNNSDNDLNKNSKTDNSTSEKTDNSDGDDLLCNTDVEETNVLSFDEFYFISLNLDPQNSIKKDASAYYLNWGDFKKASLLGLKELDVIGGEEMHSNWIDLNKQLQDNQTKDDVFTLSHFSKYYLSIKMDELSKKENKTFLMREVVSTLLILESGGIFLQDSMHNSKQTKKYSFETPKRNLFDIISNESESNNHNLEYLYWTDFDWKGYYDYLGTQLISSPYVPYIPLVTTQKHVIATTGEMTFINAYLQSIIPTINGACGEYSKIDFPDIYTLEDGKISAFSFYLGIDQSADFSQKNGTVILEDSLNIALHSSSSATYSLYGGNLKAENVYVGFEGRGTFEQFGGSHDVYDRLSLAPLPSSIGIYNLHQGSLTVQDAIIGEQGEGYFYQMGGIHEAKYLFVGFMPDSLGRYEQQDGLLSVSNDFIMGDLSNSFGEFVQFGGQTITSDLIIGLFPDATGTYTLNNGFLTATNSYIGYYGQGYFLQSGGEYNSTYLYISVGDDSKGVYELNGGNLTTQVTYIGGYYNLSSSIIGEFIQTDGTYTTNNLYLASSDKSYGVYSTSGGECYVKGNISGGRGCSELIIDGGILNIEGNASVNNMYVGYTNSGIYTQFDKTTSLQNLYLGYYTNSKGVYELRGGSLLTEFFSGDPDSFLLEFSQGIQYIGYQGEGTFLHQDGKNAVFELILGYINGAEGIYELNSGELNATYEVIGFDGMGSFIQNADTINQTHRLYLGYNDEASGKYDLNNGVLHSYKECIGFYGEGNFLQSSGTHVIDTVLSLGSDGVSSFGSYTLASGTLDTNISLVGEYGTGCFYQLSGTHNTGRLYIGVRSTGSGHYELQDGELNIDKDLYVGFSSGSAGVFEQKGGNVDLNKLIIGNSMTSDGKYVLSGGKLRANSIIVGAKGNGELNLGGTHAEIIISDTIEFGINSSFNVFSESTIHMNGASFKNSSTCPDKLSGLSNLKLVVENTGNYFEVAGKDLGTVMEGFINNFALGSLFLAGCELMLTDFYDNEPDWEGLEALYVTNLILEENSVLFLGNINLYYMNLSNNNGVVISEGGSLIQVTNDQILNSNLQSIKTFEVPAVPDPPVLYLFLWGFVLLKIFTKH